MGNWHLLWGHCPVGCSVSAPPFGVSAGPAASVSSELSTSVSSSACQGAPELSSAEANSRSPLYPRGGHVHLRGAGASLGDFGGAWHEHSCQ